MVDYLLSLLKKLLSPLMPTVDPRQRPAWFVAHIGVPGLVVLFGSSGIAGLDFFLGGEGSLAYSPLRTRYTTGGECREEAGFVLVVDRSSTAFSLSRSTQATSDAWTSLPPEAVASNRELFVVHPDRVALLSVPLLGVRDPVVVVGSGEPSKELFLPSKRVATDAFRIASRQSGAFAVWGVVAVAFAFGLSLGSAQAKETGRGEEGGGD